MPPLDNQRHELFAQELAKGKSATEATFAAGYADPRNSTRLTKNDEIRSRVAELQAGGAKRAEITVETLLGYLHEARELATKINQPTAIVAAVKEMGVLAGIRVEKSERKNVNDANQLTLAEAYAELAALDAMEARSAEAHHPERQRQGKPN